MFEKSQKQMEITLSPNKTLVIVIKIYAKADIKVSVPV